MIRVWTVFLIAVGLFPAGMKAFAYDLTNTSGRVFANVKVMDSWPNGLKVMHSKGVEFIPFSELSEGVQREYEYDPEKEKAFIKDSAERKKRQAAQREEASLLDMINKAGKRATLRIIQMDDDCGALATGFYSEIVEYEETEYRTVTRKYGLGGSQIDNRVTTRIPVKKEKKKRESRYPLPDRIFVLGLPSHLVDENVFKTMIYPCGRYQYVTVLGSSATVERYATSSKMALDIVLGREGTNAHRNENPQGGDSSLKGFGSGFIISDDGYILTNHHVVKGAREIKVKTESELLTARVVAEDSANDLALIKIDGNFSPVSFSTEIVARLGQTVFTVGFPMPELQGFSPKVTKGVISSLKGVADDVRAYQIDAAVQPGNSGGPLADENGNIVGIVVARLNDGYVLNATGSIAQNVNYAIKKSYAQNLLLGLSETVDVVQSEKGKKVVSFEEAVERVRKATVLVVVY